MTTTTTAQQNATATAATAAATARDSLKTAELHHRFMQAVHQLGVNSAVPKSIMQVCAGGGAGSEDLML